MLLRHNLFCHYLLIRRAAAQADNIDPPVGRAAGTGLVAVVAGSAIDGGASGAGATSKSLARSGQSRTMWPGFLHRWQTRGAAWGPVWAKLHLSPRAQNPLEYPKQTLDSRFLRPRGPSWAACGAENIDSIVNANIAPTFSLLACLFVGHLAKRHDLFPVVVESNISGIEEFRRS